MSERCREPNWKGADTLTFLEGECERCGGVEDEGGDNGEVFGVKELDLSVGDSGLIDGICGESEGSNGELDMTSVFLKMI